MTRACNLRSSDLQRIKACVIPAIIAHFNYCGFRFSSVDVEEVISETLVKIAKGYEKYDESRSKKAWFQKIAKRCASSYMTDHTDWRCHHIGMEMKTSDGEYYEVEYSDMECADSYHADRELTSKENVKVIKGAFDSLGEVTGKALWLQTMGYETKEIEDNLGKAGGALRTAMSRGRSQLRSNEDILRVAEEVFGCIGNKAA